MSLDRVKKRVTLKDLEEQGTWFVKSASIVDEPAQPLARFVALKNKENREGDEVMDLKTAMKKKGLSNEGLSGLTGVPSSRIAGYKTGSRTLGPKSAKKFAKHVDAESMDLVLANRGAALEKAIESEDAAGVLHAIKSIVGIAEKSAGGVDDADMDALVDFGVNFASEHGRQPAGGWGLNEVEDPNEYAKEGRSLSGERVRPMTDEMIYFEDEINDEGRTANGIRVRPDAEVL